MGFLDELKSQTKKLENLSNQELKEITEDKPAKKIDHGSPDEPIKIKR